MNLLCADTSTAKHLHLALITPQENYLHSLTIEGLEEEFLTHIETLLNKARVTLPDIDIFVLGSGPGSFMGLRLGFAVFKAWAWALGKPLALISSLEIFAHSYSGLCAPTVDAKMKKIFGALFRDGERLGSDVDCFPDEFLASLKPHPDVQILGFLGKGEQASAEGLCRAAQKLQTHQFLHGDLLLAAQPSYLRISAAEENRLKK